MFAGFVVLALAGFSCSKYKIEEPWITLGNEGLKIEKGSPAMAAGKGSGTASSAGRVSRRLRSQWLTLGAITVTLIILTGGVSIINYIDHPGERELVDELVVATYNIHHGFSNEGRIDPGRHLDLLERIDPDIIFLQESDSLLFSEGNFDPAFFIASRMDMFLFRGPNPGTGSPGVAILSRFPMEDIEVHYLPSTAIQRIALSCIVTIKEEEVRLIGLHMGLEEEERSDQIDEIVEIVSGFEEEIIMGGDFNTEPQEKMMGKINHDLFGFGNSSGNISLGLGSVWHSSPDRGGRSLDTPTYPAPDVDDEEAHIDYVLFSDGFDVKKAGIDDGIGVSDHRLVWGELEIIF
jgi:endonuclease/exonuclease/phosphatase family metal-dependent hydrolase